MKWRPSAAPADFGYALLLLALFVIACTLRFIGLGRYCFDGDEIFSLGAANADWGTLVMISARDVSHPPLFYMLLKA